jgi:NAD(P)-dependent dehydrogenase (short-subunit alcohol dehydrogenase family)
MSQLDLNQSVVITGASRGIGLSLCQHYKSNGYTVYAICREASKELIALSVTIIDAVDVSCEKGVAHMVAALKGVRIDLLINNAGILRDDRLGNISKLSVTQQFEVNALAPLVVTDALHHQMAASAKVALITSRMGSLEDNTSGGYYGYRMSKAALNIAGVSLAHDLKPKGIAVAMIHPGLVATEMIGGHGDITPDEAAVRIANRIDHLTLANSGTFWHSSGEVLPW